MADGECPVTSGCRKLTSIFIGIRFIIIIIIIIAVDSSRESVKCQVKSAE